MDAESTQNDSQVSDLFPPNQMAHPAFAATLFTQPTLVDPSPSQAQSNDQSLPLTQLQSSALSIESAPFQPSTNARATQTLTQDSINWINALMKNSETAWQDSIVAAHYAVHQLDTFINTCVNIRDAHDLINTVIRSQFKVSLMHRIHKNVVDETQWMLYQALPSWMNVTTELQRIEDSVNSAYHTLDHRLDGSVSSSVRLRNFLTQIYRSRIANIQGVHPPCSCCSGVNAPEQMQD